MPLHGAHRTSLFVWGRLLSSPLLSSGPLPSLSSHPTSLPLSLPPGREKLAFGSQREREREREGRESPLGRVTKRFPQRGSGEARARESSEGKQRCSGHHRAPDASRTAGLRERRRESERKRKKEASDDDDI